MRCSLELNLDIDERLTPQNRSDAVPTLIYPDLYECEYEHEGLGPDEREFTAPPPPPLHLSSLL